MKQEHDGGPERFQFLWTFLFPKVQLPNSSAPSLSKRTIHAPCEPTLNWASLLSAVGQGTKLEQRFTKLIGPKWRNGRRAGLKIRCPHGRVGSSPTFGTPICIHNF